MNVKMPNERLKYRIYAIPPRILVQLGSIDEDEAWILVNAVYGLRGSPRLWAETRDLELIKIELLVDGEKTEPQKPTIDTALCVIVNVSAFTARVR